MKTDESTQWRIQRHKDGSYTIHDPQGILRGGFKSADLLATHFAMLLGDHDKLMRDFMNLMDGRDRLKAAADKLIKLDVDATAYEGPAHCLAVTTDAAELRDAWRDLKRIVDPIMKGGG